MSFCLLRACVISHLQSGPKTHPATKIALSPLLRHSYPREHAAGLRDPVPQNEAVDTGPASIIKLYQITSTHPVFVL